MAEATEGGGLARRARVLLAAGACALHLAVLVPTIGQEAGSVVNDFAPEAILIEEGDLPYRGQELEYPPLSIPVLLAPAAVTEGIGAYNDAFEAWMLLFDLGIVALLALALPGGMRQVGGAVLVWSLGVLALSGIVLGDSDIDEAPLALARFDLVPAFLTLAAVLARDRRLSATWSALLAVGGAVKAYPLALYAVLARGERSPVRVAVAAAVPLAVCLAIVLVPGDEFGSAISYHTERGLQVESVAATPLEIGAIDDVSQGGRFSSGSWNFTGDGAGAARDLSVAAGLLLLLLLVAAGWRNGEIPNLELATALVAALVILSPVLSPQFLFWILPLSAAAYGLRVQNWLLVAACVATQLMLGYYSRMVVDFDGEFVWRLAGRNALLLAYLALVCFPVLRDGLASPGWRTASST